MRPSVWVGLAVVAGFAALVALDDVLPGSQDGEITDPTLALVRTHVVPLSIIAVLMVVFVRWSGWGRAVSREDADHRVPRWWWVFPVCYLVVVAGTISGVDWDLSASYLLVGVASFLLVGLTEELAVRGILLVGARGSMPEIGAFFLTCVVFALLHSLNLLHGAPLGGVVVQAAFAGFFGAIYYAVRRATGFLWAAIAVHALNDFALFAANGNADSTASDMPPWAIGAAVVLGVAAIGLVVSIIRESRRARTAAAPVAGRARA
ncbi:hypothetical protein ASF78_08120 [Cellulomonas sp. Leaf334]|nr:hypothetical protein ASF78_08120 [Cellulomonas sp. Leaf334]